MSERSKMLEARVRHPAPEGAQPVDWERLTEEYFGEVQRLRAALKKIEGDALVAETRTDTAAIARYAHQALWD